jgi:hypothetical protein
LFEEDDNMFWFIKDGLIFVPKKKRWFDLFEFIDFNEDVFEIFN